MIRRALGDLDDARGAAFPRNHGQITITFSCQG